MKKNTSAIGTHDEVARSFIPLKMRELFEDLPKCLAEHSLESLREETAKAEGHHERAVEAYEALMGSLKDAPAYPLGQSIIFREYFSRKMLEIHTAEIERRERETEKWMRHSPISDQNLE